MSDNRQRLAVQRLKASGHLVTTLTAQDLADYERRQEAVHDAMTRAIDRSNPRRDS